MNSKLLRYILYSFSASVICLTLDGCVNTMTPKQPAAFNAPDITAYSKSDFAKDVKQYRSLKKGTLTDNKVTPRALRNQIAYRVISDIETHYQTFEKQLFTQRAGFETAADVTQLGISAATTVIAAGDVKDILSASLTSFQGSRLSFDKNFFREKTSEAIIAQMRADRKSLQAQLIKSLAQRDDDNYPFEAVWIDLVDFYAAGTVPSAFVSMSNAAGTSAQIANDKLLSAKQSLAKEAIDIRTTYESLNKQVHSTDTATQQKAITTLQKILDGVGVTYSKTASGDELLTLLRTAMAKAIDDTGFQSQLNAAIQSQQ